MKKKCAKCGKEFECKHTAECWCNDLKISKNLSEYLRNNFDNCLCKNCLTEFIEKQENNFVQ